MLSHVLISLFGAFDGCVEGTWVLRVARDVLGTNEHVRAQLAQPYPTRKGGV